MRIKPYMKVAFNGCSFTVGEGFPANDRDHYIYDRLVSKRFQFDRTNIAQGGSSNYNIFMRTAAAVKSNHYDLIFVQWTALNRIWLSPGPDTYVFTNADSSDGFRYRDLYFSSAEISNLKNILLLLNHDYQNILDLIDYCGILDTMSTQTKTNLIYLNGLLPWKDDLTKPLGKDLSSYLSPYTKHMLDFDTRDDEEIVKYFTILKNKFLELDQDKWVNLFDSFSSNVVDTGPEGHHPGIMSHRWMADKITNYLTEKNIA